MIETQLDPGQAMAACLDQWRHAIVECDDAGFPARLRDIESVPGRHGCDIDIDIGTPPLDLVAPRPRRVRTLKMSCQLHRSPGTSSEGAVPYAGDQVLPFGDRLVAMPLASLRMPPE